MLDEDLKAYLIEVNHTPSFMTDTPLDYNIKFSLILDTLIIVNTKNKEKKM
jgi:tubulin polyglutamylase TTLL6/13